MLYVIVGEDVPNSLPLRQSVRADHLARLQVLHDENRLMLAGPCPAKDSQEPNGMGFTGSVIIAEFDHLEAAQNWADNDPYIDAGVYAKVTVKPFKRVF